MNLHTLSPYTLTRELDAFERMLWATDRIQPHHFLLVLELDGLPLSVDDLRAALASAQKIHPALRVRIISDPGTPPRFDPVNEPIPLQVEDQTEEATWLDTAALELATPFDAERGPLVRARLIRGESTTHLMLAVHHAIGDGLSAAYLARDMLESAKSALRPSLPARMSLERLVTQTPPASRLHEVSSTTIRTPSLRPEIAYFTFPPEIVDELVLRCRQERATLHSAVTTAALLAMDEPMRSCLSPISARPHLPSIEDEFGLYITSGVTSIASHASDGFWAVARTVRMLLDRARTLEHLNGSVTAMRSMLSNIRNDEDMKALWDSLRVKLGYQAVLSNLGRLPFAASESEFRVSAAWLLLNVEAVPVVGVVTAGGRLSVTMSTSGGEDHGAWFERFGHLLSLAIRSVR